MVNSKCHRHQICIDGLYLTCFLNSKINAKSVDLPKNTMTPATFSTILWCIPTFQNKPAKTEKVCNPTTFDSWRHRVPVNCHLLVSHLQMGFVSFFKIIQGTSIDPHFQICSQISPNIYKFDHGHFEYFTPYCTLIPVCAHLNYTCILHS